MHRAPDQHVVTRAGHQRVRALDYRRRDHPGLKLRVPSHLGRERQMVDNPGDAHDIDAVTVAGAEKRRFGICREPVDLLRAQPRVRDRFAARVEREQSQRPLGLAHQFRESDPDDRGLAPALPHRDATLRSDRLELA